jgi:purine-binding chemotaxis protein CheW
MKTTGSSDSKTREILRRRAAELARVPVVDDGLGETLEVVEFSLAGERYGAESGLVAEVLHFSNCTPLPCTPPFVLGLVNVRGRFVHAIEIGRFLGLPARGIVDLHHLLIVRHGGIELGIVADLVAGLRRVPLASLQPPPAALAGHLRGMTAERLALLDIPSILADPRQVVDEEVDV